MARFKIWKNKVPIAESPPEQGVLAAPVDTVTPVPTASPLQNLIGRSFSTAEVWVSERVDWVVWVLVLIGFYLRYQRAAQDFLNGDEVQIMLPPMQRGLLNVYEAGLTFPYGPLINFLLHFMTFFGNSELYFRIPSILAGALLPYVTYRWASITLGKAAALGAACILAFSPNLLNLSAEVRHYIIHTFFMACALYFLEQAFQKQSRRHMRLFGASLLLALLTMYMSIWFTAAIGVYALVRILKRELPGSLVIEWALIQMVAAGLCIAAYTTHLYKLRGSPSERLARDTWLRSSYFHPESQTLLDYVTGATRSLFDYVFSNSTLGLVAECAFAIGIVLILLRKAGIPGNRRVPALALVMTPLVTLMIGIIAFYPYGGSRHDAYLSVFLAAGTGVTLAFLARGKVIVILLAAALLCPQWRSVAQHHYLEDPPQFRKLDQMKSALGYFSTRVPRPRVLLTDGQGTSMLAYYVCGRRTEEYRHPAPNLTVFRCGEYSIVAVDDWAASEAILIAALSKARAAEPVKFPDPVWIFQLSPEKTSIDYVANENNGLFGRINLRRVF